MPQPSATISNLLAARIRAALPKELGALDRIRSYAEDPVGFARDILGIRLWRRQRDILQALVTGNRVAVCSGHKIGKSVTLAVAALWFYASFPRSRTILTATTERQVDGIIWREVRWLARQAERKGYKLPGLDDIHISARSGLKDPEDQSEIFGFTAREVEAVAGISAPKMLWLVDEASGVDDRIFEAIFGNMLGGAKIALISNPTRSVGEFARAFAPNSGYQTFEVSSLEVPNCTGEEERIPGLAEPEEIAALEQKFGGKNDPRYRVRVLGQFVTDDEGCIFPFDIRERAMQLWHEGAANEPEGPLVLSLDPAGDKGEGDESVFGVRRGTRLIALVAARGLNEDGHVSWLQGLVKEHGKPGERPTIVFDRDGPIGYKLIGPIRGAFPNASIVAVRGTNDAARQPGSYGNTRDELFANLADRMRAGEAELPDHKMLSDELAAPKWTQDVRGRSKATAKKELRKMLGRSPDRLDCVCLAFWPRTGDARKARVREEVEAEPAADWIEPYAECDLYEGRLDPYA